MAAYVISELEVLDEQHMGEYSDLAAASIAEYGGKYLTRGAQAVVVEGGITDRRFVIVEFPSMQRAKEWYTSASYARALKVRNKALDRRLIFVEGLAAGNL
jgi:uncharacterized protein (DUF1330 family)